MPEDVQHSQHLAKVARAKLKAALLAVARGRRRGVGGVVVRLLVRRRVGVVRRLGADALHALSRPAQAPLQHAGAVLVLVLGAAGGGLRGGRAGGVVGPPAAGGAAAELAGGRARGRRRRLGPRGARAIAHGERLLKRQQQAALQAQHLARHQPPALPRTLRLPAAVPLAASLRIAGLQPRGPLALGALGPVAARRLHAARRQLHRQPAAVRLPVAVQPSGKQHTAPVRRAAPRVQRGRGRGRRARDAPAERAARRSGAPRRTGRRIHQLKVSAAQPTQRLHRRRRRLLARGGAALLRGPQPRGQAVHLPLQLGRRQRLVRRHAQLLLQPARHRRQLLCCRGVRCPLRLHRLVRLLQLRPRGRQLRHPLRQLRPQRRRARARRR
mmetsp:Transcript_26316/g.66230  ORF Transcript_26316/g.66230 Transcript_26316/m.66230 type:complete len:384 (-) Transcript_26316:73-1224(-)